MSGALILIVEDNPKNLKLFRDVLQFKGYQTIEAESAEAGIALARERKPALILMDIQLPQMNGDEAMKVLKADDTTRHIPIVAVTSFAMKGDRERLLADGFNAYVSKPIDIKELPQIVEHQLSEQS
ncbi:MAG: response regulator [Gammaproteobacteria bacterium]|nr:response regulator [Gammaproteobacteria bacterium]NIV49657.1 response regulator [Gammaproteobacteria bacterium]NIW57055.1 response regulator [Gammaproteobacteria bacterium]